MYSYPFFSNVTFFTPPSTLHVLPLLDNSIYLVPFDMWQIMLFKGVFSFWENLLLCKSPYTPNLSHPFHQTIRIRYLVGLLTILFCKKKNVTDQNHPLYKLNFFIKFQPSIFKAVIETPFDYGSVHVNLQGTKVTILIFSKQTLGLIQFGIFEAFINQRCVHDDIRSSSALPKWCQRVQIGVLD